MAEYEKSPDNFTREEKLVYLSIDSQRWANSEEGQKAMNRANKEAVSLERIFKESRILSYELLTQPID